MRAFRAWWRNEPLRGKGSLVIAVPTIALFAVIASNLALERSEETLNADDLRVAHKRHGIVMLAGLAVGVVGGVGAASLFFSGVVARVKELAEGQDSMKLLMIAGPKDELEILRNWADKLDAQLCVMAGIERDTNPESFVQRYEVVDLKYIEPIHAQFDLTARVKGLYVTILPDPVTPGIQGESRLRGGETVQVVSGCGTRWARYTSRT